MARRLAQALVTVTVAGALTVPAAASATASAPPAAAPAVVAGGLPTGSLADWQKGQWWVDSVRLKSWHEQGVTGKGVTIALLDGPVAPGIPDLQGQDVRPTATTCNQETFRKWGPTTPDGPLDATSFHTTSMAAVLVGSGRGNGPGGAGILGVAPGATLRTYAIFNSVDPAAHQNLDCFPPALPALVDRMVADGADIIHIPLDIDYYAADLQAAYNRAINKGVVIVCGSGNGGPTKQVSKTALGDGILVVGGMGQGGQVLATNPTSTLQSWEQARDVPGGLNIHLVAPGADIVGGGLTTGNGWDSTVLQSGSSGSSAIVAGQLALMKQKWPKATSNQLLVSLLRGARRPDGGAVWDPRRGFGTTSFESTLTTDPTRYPDVNPIFYTMGNVISDHPGKPYIPEQVGADGLLPPPPAGYLGARSSTSATGTSSTSPSSAPAVVGQQQAGAEAAAATSGAVSGWLVWLLGGVLAVAAAAAGGWALRKRGRDDPAPDGRAGAPGRQAGALTGQGRDQAHGDS